MYILHLGGTLYILSQAVVCIALIGVVAYTCVAREYQYQERDEPDNIYRYAKDYYANAQDESSYGYDNDNLDVRTIINNRWTLILQRCYQTLMAYVTTIQIK